MDGESCRFANGRDADAEKREIIDDDGERVGWMLEEYVAVRS
jgi:hypothetical protein